MTGDPSNTLDVVRLYGVEANLVQVKIGHILTIRSVAIPLLAGVIGSALLYPSRGLEFLTITLVPFYLIESIYDGYLIPIVGRETVLRGEIAKLGERTGEVEKLVQAYRGSIDHRKTPQQWNPFTRAFLEPIRVVFYASMIAIPIIIFNLHLG